MKKIALTLLLGSAGFASTETCEVTVPEAKSVISYHQIVPNFRWLKHKEEGYTFSKYIAGFEYNYIRSEGMNFNSFIGYSIYKDKTYFMADWATRYKFNIGKSANTNLYPIIGMTNTSHFSTNTNDETYQIYRSAFAGGVGGCYDLFNFVQIDANINYFRDLATSCIMHRGDEFWGKNYYSPSGLKLNVNLIFNSLMSKTIEIGGFYAQTLKNCYKEYGFRTAVAFSF